MACQTRHPDEIVIVDAGSKDGTWELMQAEAARTDRPWKFRALQERRCNVARGRNLAIQAAHGDLIVSTDIGCSWEPEWLAELVAPLEMDNKVELVIGSWAVDTKGLNQAWSKTEWSLFGEQRLEADSDSYSSSRSIAYHKSTWQRLGKYPEDLTFAGDDAVFHYLIEKAEIKRVGAPTVRCYWHRHVMFTSFLKEAYRYGLGDGEAGIRTKDVILIGGRMALELFGLLLGLMALFPIMPGAPWLGFVLLGVALSSVAAKALKLRPAVRRLAAAGVNHPFWRLLAFSYGTKWHWIRGHAIGRWRGRQQCCECRRRLREMTPERYRNGNPARPS